jgi:hypothetical protein
VSPIVLSLFTRLWIVCLLGTLSLWNLHRNFWRHFPADCISHGWHTEMHIALKHAAPWHTTLSTNWHWEQMTNGADNCCLLLTNHKQTPKHEPHCSPCNIIPSSGQQVNYYPSFQTLLAIRHTDSLAKFACVLQQAVPWLPWRAEPWTQSTQ